MSGKTFIGRVRQVLTLRNAVKTVLWGATLAVLFYVEEDWRGARAWAATKAEWEARGESFDYARLIPPAVPDRENLAMLPIFQVVPDPGRPGGWMSRLQEANSKVDVAPYKRNWQTGGLTDAHELSDVLAESYRKAFPNAPVPQDGLEQFDQLYPFMDGLRAAAAVRRYCRMPQDYPPQSPFSRMLALSTGQIATAKVLTLHSDLALSENKPDVALEDIRINFMITDGMTREPFLVSGLVAIGMSAINLNTVYNGLNRHSWDDAQLAELERILSGIDFLADYQHALRGEIVGMTLPLLDEMRADRPIYAVDQASGETKQESSWNFWPTGWIDARKADATERVFSAVHLIDLKSRVVDAPGADQLTGDPVLSALKKFSRMQVWVDEVRIACGLERYRLAHGTYPDSLEALVPDDVDRLPHDIMNGEPYCYRLRPEGTFLLYSVGWNQKDDGGVEAFQKDSPKAEELTQGDWVWPVPKVAGP